MKNLIHFSKKYDLDQYDREPLPEDIYNSEGAILAHKGMKLSAEKLGKSYIISDEKYEEHDLNIYSKETNEAPIDEETKFAMSDAYEEETAETIESRLDNLPFEPLHNINTILRKNIYQLKELYQKVIVDGVTSLMSKDNSKISLDVIKYLEKVVDNSIYASDFMDMIHSIRNRDNYNTFSHATCVAFYSMAITKKLQMLKEDLYGTGERGRWIPLKTKKNNSPKGILQISNMLLKYIDYQKSNIMIKYSADIKESLYERLHDIMFEYAQMEPVERYATLNNIEYDKKNMYRIGIAALNADIGKIHYPNKILNKPRELTKNEYRQMMKHPVQSVSSLKEAGVKNDRIFAYILGHHRLSPEIGYPPMTNTPPYESKIIAIADIYDAMRSPKYYRKVHTQDETFDYLTELYNEGCFDKALYLSALHTFDEYNHIYVTERTKKKAEKK